MLSYKYFFAAVDLNKAWNRQERRIFHKFIFTENFLSPSRARKSFIYISSCTEKIYLKSSSHSRKNSLFIFLLQFFTRWLLNDHWLTAEDIQFFFSMKNFSSSIFQRDFAKKNVKWWEKNRLLLNIFFQTPRRQGIFRGVREITCTTNESKKRGMRTHENMNQSLLVHDTPETCCRSH